MGGLNLKLKTLERQDENIGLSTTLGWVRTFQNRVLIALELDPGVNRWDDMR